MRWCRRWGLEREARSLESGSADLPGICEIGIGFPSSFLVRLWFLTSWLAQCSWLLVAGSTGWQARIRITARKGSYPEHLAESLVYHSARVKPLPVASAQCHWPEVTLTKSPGYRGGGLTRDISEGPRYNQINTKDNPVWMILKCHGL